MILAEALPDPNSYTAIGWLVVSLAAVISIVNRGWDLVIKFRGKEPQPPNSMLESDHRALKERVKLLEDWRKALTLKMDTDKQEILDAGSNREIALRSEIQVVAGRLDNLNSTVQNIPGEFMALLANAKNILGKGGN